VAASKKTAGTATWRILTSRLAGFEVLETFCAKWFDARPHHELPFRI
jgi:hypothetical protein